MLARICSQKTFLNCHDVQSVTLSCVQLPQLPTFHLTDTFQDFKKRLPSLFVVGSDTYFKVHSICYWTHLGLQGSSLQDREGNTKTKKKIKRKKDKDKETKGQRDKETKRQRDKLTLACKGPRCKAPPLLVECTGHKGLRRLAQKFP